MTKKQKYSDGDTSTCKVCGWRIIYFDNHWMHVSKSDTHPATPSDITTWQVVFEEKLPEGTKHD